MNQTGHRRILPDQSSGSGHTFGSPRHPSIKDPILSKRVCFYKSGDPQFNGLRMVINNRTFKTFDALLDSLSKKVPLPFGVRNITTPRGVHAIYTLDELEDGKSYICSDSRKVKPINLALARKKLPPWYHARPVSSRRRTVQQARFFPGRNIHKQERMVVRTPKRLLVFRNGDPTVKYTVVLHKRTTPTFESILEYISELMQFHVVKLYTPDGRRVDGLTGLILCSGTVVAAGREPFRSANYNVQKSPAPTRLPTNRMGLRRLKSLNRKKKSLSYSSKSRNFSPSSERYIVDRIHNSIVTSSCDLPSNPTNSVELESSRILESVAGTEGDACLGDGAEGQGCLLPTEDDIEKSFRVNQDGSMTVEMRVRLTIKEEETIHWTTTLTRSSVANQLNTSCLPESEAEQAICSSKSNSLDLQSPAASIDSINKDKNKDNNDDDPPSLSNGAFSESGNEEDNIKLQTDVMPPRRAPTPGHKQIRKKQASVESIKSLMAEGIQENLVGSYSYKEQTENGAMTEQYCLVKQSTTRPIPKPRRLSSVDANKINSRNVSTFKSAGMTEILQIESSGEEVTETVLHIYEQQTCQDNFLANICAQGMSGSEIPFDRPATSETGHLSSNNDFEPELWRPSTASESISMWRAENMSEGIANFSIDGLNANNVSCAEALKMIESLREIASIEDSHKLQASLSNLQQSTSKQLLQSWKGFQELSNKSKSRSSTPNYSEQELIAEASPEKDCDIEENVIDEMMDNLDIPEKLKEELASLSMGVKTESDDEERMSTGFIEKEELSSKDNSDSTESHSSTEDVLNVRDVPQDEKDVDVSSIIKKFTNIYQPKQSDTGSIPRTTETVKHKPTDQATKAGVATCSTAEPHDKQTPEERQLYSTVFFAEEDREATNSSEEENLGEKKQHHGHTEDKSNQEKANMNRVVGSKENLENKSPEVECRPLQVQSEESMSIPENEFTSEDESDEEEDNHSSANKDREEKESCKQSVYSSEAGGQHSSEEEQLEVECEEIKQERSEGGDLSNPDSHSEEEEDKQPSSNYYVELNVREKTSMSSPDSENQSLPEEEQPEVECVELSNKDTLSYPASLLKSEKEPEIQKSYMGLNVSVEESTGNSDVDEPTSSEEEQPEVEYKSSLMKSDSLAKRHRFDADEDSGNDHSSCEEQVEVGQPQITNVQISNSIEEELSYYEKETCSEEEHADVDRYKGESCKEYQEAPPLVTQSEDTKCEKAVEKVKHQPEEVISQSVAERVSCLEKQVADAQMRRNVTESLAISRVSQRTAQLESDAEDSPSESPTSQSAFCTQSAPQSSLSFSYDSSGVITKEPEGNRVRSIREMFLAKSAPDIQHGHRRFPSQSPSELSELRAETSASGGYQSQTSSELSSGEDDSARKSITKGFDELSTASKSSVNADSVADTKDNSEDTKMWTERNGKLPAVGVTDFKMMDNKVHPLIEVPSDGEVVVMQPGKGQGVMNRRLQEPDMLDLLYNFCGQHCPIL
ncbi:oxygen-regulated protein 1-like [Toxotes jaculatrix]|uniref:oxygen-regulated protein 1-like n=1 Tax=Toxotes jaculatrix TaxID=941984 RepID=UPI001B3A9F71|nr:oxygen-regulated protein 1-like [Toxotes jaculatrix]